MNGRMGVYPAASGNPILGRFLGVDPIIQDAGNSQSINGYGYALNNPMKYIDPSGYSYQRFMEIFAMEQRDNKPSEFFNNYPAGWEQTVHNYNSSIGPGMGLNGPGSNGIYYDWYSGDLKSTVTRGDVDYMPYGVGIDWMTISYLLSNPANIHIGMVYFTDGSKADWNLWINNNLPSGSGGYSFNVAYDILGGTGLINGLAGFDAGVSSRHTYVYAQRINGKVVSAAKLTALNRAKALKVLNASKSIATKLNVASAIVITGDVLYNSHITASQGLNAFMTGIAFTGWGAPVAGLWFVADFGTGLFTGKSLSDRLDSRVGAPLIDWNW